VGVWMCTNTVCCIVCILVQIHHGIDFGNELCNVYLILFVSHGAGALK
jgi:hypothetical protein